MQVIAAYIMYHSEYVNVRKPDFLCHIYLISLLRKIVVYHITSLLFISCPCKANVTCPVCTYQRKQKNFFSFYVAEKRGRFQGKKTFNNFLKLYLLN